MTRATGYIVAAVAALVLIWILFSLLLHTLLVGFWLVIGVLLGLGVYRIGRRSGRRNRS
jgi:hypothetical protein